MIKAAFQFLCTFDYIKKQKPAEAGFFILRGLYCEPTIKWPAQLNLWMKEQELELESGVVLLMPQQLK
ncbi:hypothetical protein GCM10008107_28730 [Psychrosphaera saromensis]|uniref:Uncharacterized protein n=1 Tax=Psychrosphaera saromensis TaxID=716813 RepID=A0A2S7UTX9_9GAMM|nr:hypothetical protein [Psychrosphaera saromensis]PQJ52982.1 hypothetical protein BTO11_04465 [Psychrosphaera saromensis]GHB77445.1 hypothetical protein GCM10008107_28730 [Psychrosphaera saromensis]GLQ12858.1 hypothetical protein GCM10007917_03130 [Psychrosphaera saromensis]